MTTTALRYLLALLAHLPTVSVNVGCHYGDVHHGPVYDDRDEAAELVELEHAAGVPVYPLPAPMLRDLFEEVAIARGNGCTVDEAADTGMATLMLANIEATGPET